jgi:methionine aminopeptidase
MVVALEPMINQGTQQTIKVMDELANVAGGC